MKWFIVNQLARGARLYWSDDRGQWGCKSVATQYERLDPKKELALCFLGAFWLNEVPL